MHRFEILFNQLPLVGFSRRMYQCSIFVAGGAIKRESRTLMRTKVGHVFCPTGFLHDSPEGGEKKRKDHSGVSRHQGISCEMRPLSR